MRRFDGARCDVRVLCCVGRRGVQGLGDCLVRGWRCRMVVRGRLIGWVDGWGDGVRSDGKRDR